MTTMIGKIVVKQFDLDTNRLVDIINLGENVILYGGASNIALFCAGAVSYPVTSCAIGIGGLGTDSPSMTSLINYIAAYSFVPSDFSIVQDDLSIVFKARFNRANSLFIAHGTLFINEMGLVLSNGDYFTYKSFPSTPFEIKNGILSIVEYEVKLRRFTLSSISSESSLSSLSSHSSHSSTYSI